MWPFSLSPLNKGRTRTTRDGQLSSVFKLSPPMEISRVMALRSRAESDFCTAEDEYMLAPEKELIDIAEGENS